MASNNSYIYYAFSYFLLEKEQQCHQIFLTTDYVTRRKTVPNRHKGTLEWVLRDVNYVNWMSDETNFLWIPGDPGMGKTGMAASLAISTK
jgi:cytidylate kinase